jgi:hypothetical protein
MAKDFTEDSNFKSVWLSSKPTLHFIDKKTLFSMGLTCLKDILWKL